ncbi:Uncharacterised protein [Vibrio cholerae]|nr:Uncharacterised protein [Vibrio cholerae]
MLVTFEIASISPTCSTAGAIATGIINRMALMLNSGKVKLGNASQAACSTAAKLTTPITSETA